MKLEDMINQDQVIDLNTLKAERELLQQIQKKLSELGLYPNSMIDGVFGQSTEAALIKFCEAVNLDSMGTGKFDRLFAEKLLNTKELTRPSLNDVDYKQAADLLGVEVAVIRAVVEVEAAGAGFLADGRPKILFERHWFYQLTALPVSKTRPDLSNPQPGGYLGGVREWDRLNSAIALDRTAALKSASWGLGQVMGFNYKLAAYEDVEEFVKAMYLSEGKQLEAMMNFIKNQNLAKALRDRDWVAFARRYNGPQFWRNQYDKKLAAAYAKYAAVAKSAS
jgi:peptidoglycan hydrolase-like protein with peptidoglycan-binding domain